MKTFETELGTAFNADCFEIMKTMPDGCVDMILADLPYGTTACKWDTVIPFEPMWKEFNRITKLNAAIVLTASQPFTSNLISSNYKGFKHCWIWNKGKAGNFAIVKFGPLRVTEDICVFSKGKLPYFPQMEVAEERNKRPRGVISVQPVDSTHGKMGKSGQFKVHVDHDESKRYPKNILDFKVTEGECNQIHRIHPTQKPVALFKYLIKTYTNEGDFVFDPTAGSLTTGVAAENLKRTWACVEQDEGYFDKGCGRFN